MSKEPTTINLVNDGVFPIIFDKDGNRKARLLDTGLDCSGGIQGEGKLSGVPSLLLRTSGCNLHCSWRMPDGTSSICDTPYSSWAPESNPTEINEIITLLKNNIGNIKHLVVTGGEPMIQANSLIVLLKSIKKYLKLHITLETNGTKFHPEVAQYVDLISLSPKLASSTPWQPNLRGTGIEYIERYALAHERIRYSIRDLQNWINTCYEPIAFPNGIQHYEHRSEEKDFQLKFVVGSLLDIEEIKEKYLRFLKGVEPFDIMLMPLGLNRDQLDMTTKLTLQECVKNGWRYTPRIHIDIFNDKRSV